MRYDDNEASSFKRSIPEIICLIGSIDAIEFDFDEREPTPKNIMKLGLQRHLSGLSLFNAVTILDELSINRASSPVDNRVQQSVLEPEAGRESDETALDEPAVKVNKERVWLTGAIEPETAVLLHIKLSPTRNTAAMELFLQELAKNQDGDDTEFLVDGPPWHKAEAFESGVDFRHETFGGRHPVERAFEERKSGTEHCYVLSVEPRRNVRKIGCSRSARPSITFSEQCPGRGPIHQTS